MATETNTKMSFAQMVAERARLDAAIAAQRSEEMKVLADGYAKKMAAAGFTPQEALDALLPYLPAKAVRAKRGTRTPKAEHVYIDRDSTGVRPEIGNKYKDPTSGVVWEKKKMGALKSEFKAALAAGKTWAQMIQK